MSDQTGPTITIRARAAARFKYWLKGCPRDHLPVIEVNGTIFALKGRRGCKTEVEAVAKAQRRIDQIIREIKTASR